MKKHNVHTIGELVQRKKYGYVRYTDDGWDNEEDDYDSDIEKNKWDDDSLAERLNNRDDNDDDDDDDLLGPSNPLSPLNPTNPASPLDPMDPLNPFFRNFKLNHSNSKGRSSRYK